MSNEQIQEKTISESTRILQGRPQRRSGRGLAILLSLLGGVVILSVVAIVAWHALSSTSSATGSAASTSRKGNNNSAVIPGWNDPATFWDPIRTQVAQGLHLSVAQVTAKLQLATPQSTVTTNKSSAPSPGAAMTQVAAQQSLSTEQLRTLELNALQQGCDEMVAHGRLSQADANQRMQMFEALDQGTLNWYVMHAFTGQ
jgi:hypothetical protein